MAFLISWNFNSTIFFTIAKNAKLSANKEFQFSRADLGLTGPQSGLE